MRFHSRKSVWPAALLLIIGIFIIGMYGWRKEVYLLNKNVRLVSLRLMKYEELARHRGYIYRMKFLADHYRVDARPVHSDKEWREVAVFSYEKGVGTTVPGFALEINRGQIVSFYYGEKRGKQESFLILSFCHQKNPWRRSGILCFRGGAWRVLGR